MKKELPKIYKGNVSSDASHNLRSSYGISEEIDVRNEINKLFKENKLYKKEVEIEINEETIKTKIIGKTENHIISIDNRVIKIDDIKKFKIL